MPTLRWLVFTSLVLLAVAIPTLGTGLSIDSMVVTPADPVVGWGTPFTVTVVVSGGVGPYTYSWTQIGGSPIAISGADSDTIAGTTPTRVENLTDRDRTVWQVTGWSARETSIELWCVVSDSLSETVAGSVFVTMAPFSSIGEGFVGLGTEVVLNGVDQPLYNWSLDAPGGSSLADFEGGSAATQAPYFFPDVEGSYVATETYSGEPVTVIAGQWKGVGTIDGASPTVPQCAVCHAVEAATWGETGHSVHYSDHVYSSYAGDPKSDCMPCHTVGYNDGNLAYNQGYDDVVDEYMYTWTTEPYDCGHDGICPSDPSYAGPDADGTESDGIPDLPADFSDLPDEVKQRTNIQCENCHGPYVDHIDGSPNTPAGHQSWEPSVCGSCHAREVEWLESGHTQHSGSDASVGLLCIECHAGDYFVDIQIDGNAPPAVPPDKGEPIGCPACHDPHENQDWDGDPATDENQLRAWGFATLPDGTTADGIGSGALCMLCHNGWLTPSQMATQIASGSLSFGPHDGSQGVMMAGVMGYEYVGETYTDSYHATDIENQCVACHMAATPGLEPDYDPLAPGHGILGGHTMAMSQNPVHQPGIGGIENTTNACGSAGCHVGLTSYDRLADADYDGDGTINGVQTEVRGLLNILAQLLPPYYQNTVYSELDDTNSTVVQRRAAWNWFFVSLDGSFGIHNTDYTVQLLQTAIANTPDPPFINEIFADGFESGDTSAWSSGE